MKIFNSSTLPTLFYGCKIWAIREQDKYRITSVEMKFVGRMEKYTLQDYKTNEYILSKIRINPDRENYYILHN